jgi:hypothetical protein
MAFELPYQFVNCDIFRRHIVGGPGGFAGAMALSIGRWARAWFRWAGSES